MRLIYGVLITFIFLNAPAAFSAAPNCRFVLDERDQSTFVQKLIGYKVAKDHEVFRQGGSPSAKAQLPRPLELLVMLQNLSKEMLANPFHKY